MHLYSINICNILKNNGLLRQLDHAYQSATLIWLSLKLAMAGKLNKKI